MIRSPGGTVLILAIGVGALTALAAPPPRGASPRCYALRFGEWTFGDESLRLHEPLPTGVALFDEPVDTSRRLPWQFAERWPSDSANVGAIWQRAGKDSLVISFPAGWSTGIAVELPSRGETVRGRAQIYVDYGPSKPTWASVAAHRIACPPLKHIPKRGT